MNIAFFGTTEDRPYFPRLTEVVGVASLKATLTPQTTSAIIYAQCAVHNIQAIIVTCPITMTALLSALPDFRHPTDKRGNQKKLSLDDYAGSFFTIINKRNNAPLDVLVLNPLKHLVSTPSGMFIAKRFVSKVTRPQAWFPQTDFTWQLWKPEISDQLLVKFMNARLLSVDIETYRDDELRRIHCVGYCALFADGSTHSIVVPFKDMLAHSFVKKLNASNVPKLFQNGRYDNAYFARWNVVVNNWLHDTLHLFHSWYAELPKRLDFITAFAVRKVRYWKDDSAGDEYNLFEYNAKDCWATMNAYLSLLKEAPAWATNNYLQEFPLVFPCAHVELDGILLDKARFDAAKAKAEERLEEVAVRIRTIFGDKFNPGSSDQVKRLLTVLGMGPTPESSDNAALVACASAHPFNEHLISLILAYRKQSKLLSTYFQWDKFWLGRCLYQLDPAGTDSGRLASRASNFWTGLQIQNIPRGPAIKQFFMCDYGWDGLGEGDYSQSEARCVGYMSGCQSLINLVESDKDYHRWNAHKFFGVDYDKIDTALRDLAKRVNHGANYNMGASVLLDTMGPKRVAQARLLLSLPAKWSLIDICKHLLQVYERTYPEVKRDWYNAIKREISLTKKLVSPLGWTRYFFADPSKSKPALNAAVAHGPQNLSVSVINRPFYRLWRDSVYGDLRGRLRIKAQIHDSIFFAWRGAEVPSIVQERMRNPVQVRDINGVTRTMLIPVDMSIGKGDKPAKYWSELK